MAISHRGNPEQFDQDRALSYYTIHCKLPATPDGTFEARPACGYGAWNLRWSSLLSEVTCVKCLTAVSRAMHAQLEAGLTVPDLSQVGRPDVEGDSPRSE